MTKFQRQNIVDEYAKRDKKCDRLEDKINKANAEGDTARADRLNRLLDKTSDEMWGMNIILAALGYRIVKEGDAYYTRRI